MGNVGMFDRGAWLIVSSLFSRVFHSNNLDGFAGANKIFLLEYAMPVDPAAGDQFNGDMPAIWMLNAQIPRTSQYGKEECSCWKTGCGEFDIGESTFTLCLYNLLTES